MLQEYKTPAGALDPAAHNLAIIKDRQRKYLGIDVLEAAVQRAKFLFSTFDTVAVAFSGGKDSIVTLELLDMVRIDMGIEKKITVFFWDEELISNAHADFMKEIYDSGRFIFNWMCAPLRSEKYILGNNSAYIQWDITREFIRPLPEWAIDMTHCAASDENTVFTEHFQKALGANYVLCLGIRAQEGQNRLNATMVAADIDRPYLVKESGGTRAKPIYDWSEKDIFKFIQDYGIKCAPVYDTQAWGKCPLRVATPFHSEGAKNLPLLKQYDPEFYDRLTTVFPEMIVQARYYKDLDTQAVYEKYGVHKQGILDYVEENIKGRSKEKCLKILTFIWKTRDEEKQTGRDISAFPYYYLFQNIVNGGYKRTILPIPNQSVTPKMLDYEKKAKEYEATAD